MPRPLSARAVAFRGAMDDGPNCSQLAGQTPDRGESRDRRVAEPIVRVCRIRRVAAIVGEQLLDARPDVGMPLGRNVVQAMPCTAAWAPTGRRAPLIRGPPGSVIRLTNRKAEFMWHAPVTVAGAPHIVVDVRHQAASCLRVCDWNRGGGVACACEREDRDAHGDCDEHAERGQ
jgi:hypothetical protein